RRQSPKLREGGCDNGGDRRVDRCSLNVAAVPAIERRTAMVEHIVLFRWTEGASQEAIDRALSELRALKGKIADIMVLSCGANFSSSAKGYTLGLVGRFKDRAALEAYLAHPEHQRVVHSLINPIRADLLIFDYEF